MRIAIRRRVSPTTGKAARSGPPRAANGRRRTAPDRVVGGVLGRRRVSPANHSGEGSYAGAAVSTAPARAALVVTAQPVTPRPRSVLLDSRAFRTSVRSPRQPTCAPTPPPSPAPSWPSLLAEPSLARGVVHHAVLPAAPGRSTPTSRTGSTRGSWPAWPVAGIERPYTHQAEAIEAVHAGRDVVVVTPTASGKTLCYSLPDPPGDRRGSRPPGPSSSSRPRRSARTRSPSSASWRPRAGCTSRRRPTTATRRRRSARRSGPPARSSSPTRTCSTRRSCPTTRSGSSCSSSSGSSSSTSCTPIAACSGATSPTSCAGCSASAPTTAASRSSSAARRPSGTRPSSRRC